MSKNNDIVLAGAIGLLSFAPRRFLHDVSSETQLLGPTHGMLTQIGTEESCSVGLGHVVDEEMDLDQVLHDLCLRNTPEASRPFIVQ